MLATDHIRPIVVPLLLILYGILNHADIHSLLFPVWKRGIAFCSIVFIVFTLLHTNDFHNHLSDVQADYLCRLRAAVGTHGLLVDAGDAVASGNITYKSGGEAILKTMNTIGYDAMSVGNREFHFSRVGFHCKVGLARFPVLCANIRLSRQSASALYVACHAL